MSNISAQILRRDNFKIIVANISISYDGSYDKCYLSFKCDNGFIDALSTSGGNIQNGKITLSNGESNINAEMEHVSGLESFECLISYLQGENLIFYETLVSHIEKTSSIVEFSTDISTAISHKKENFHDQLIDFKHSLTRRRSPWRIYLSVDNDISVFVKSYGKNRIFISFGEKVVDVMASDFIFPIEPKRHTVIIPKEIFWINYKLYPEHSFLCISELVKADFHSIDNVYYKCFVSNFIPLSSFPRKPKVHLDSFNTPVGGKFNTNIWSLGEDSGLPIYMR